MRLGAVSLAILAVAVTVAVIALTRGGEEVLRVPVGKAHGLAPAGSGVAAALFDSGALSAVDENGKVRFRVDVGSHPTNPAATGGTIWVPVVGDHRLVGVDAASGRIVRRLRGTYAAAVAGPPGSLFLPTWRSAPDRPTLWRGNEVTRLDVRSGNPVWRRTLGGIVLTVAYASGRLWVPDFSGNHVTVLDARDGSTVTVTSLPGRPVAAAAGADCAWVALAGGPLLRLDPRTARVTGQIAIGNVNVDYMQAADGGAWLVPYTSPSSATLEHASCASGRIDRRDSAEGASQGLALSGGHVWLADYGRGRLIRMARHT